MYNYFKRSRHSDRLKHGRITRTGFAAYTEENTMYDLHTHSRCSDGSESPEHVAELAKAAGIELLALTDHDCVRGVPAALSRAAQLGLRMLPGVEAEADYADTLHILGIGQDIDAPCFQKLLAEQTALREERNRLLEIKLRKMGMDVSDYLIRSESTTRANYAAALTAAGHAENTADAFRRILNRDALADIKQKHPSPQAVIDAVTGAGGAAILAHPMLMKNAIRMSLSATLPTREYGVLKLFTVPQRKVKRGFSLPFPVNSDCLQPAEAIFTEKAVRTHLSEAAGAAVRSSRPRFRSFAGGSSEPEPPYFRTSVDAPCILHYNSILTTEFKTPACFADSIPFAKSPTRELT